MELRWTPARAEHITHRSDRYPDATDIDVAWTREAATDGRKLGPTAESGSRPGVVRIVGFSPTAGFVVTVIAIVIDDDHWGVTAWKTTGAERRRYWEAHDESTH